MALNPEYARNLIIIANSDSLHNPITLDTNIEMCERHIGIANYDAVKLWHVYGLKSDLSHLDSQRNRLMYIEVQIRIR